MYVCTAIKEKGKRKTGKFLPIVVAANQRKLRRELKAREERKVRYYKNLEKSLPSYKKALFFIAIFVMVVLLTIVVFVR